MPVPASEISKDHCIGGDDPLSIFTTQRLQEQVFF